MIMMPKMVAHPEVNAHSSRPGSYVQMDFWREPTRANRRRID